MQFENCEGEQVEIPTLEIKDTGNGEEHVKVSNKEDFELVVQCMGWKDTAQFEKETGVTADELIGEFWFTIGDQFGHNRIYY